MPVSDWSTTANSNTSVAGVNIQGSAAVQNMDNGLRAIMAEAKAKFDSLDATDALKLAVLQPSVDVPSATTTDIGAAASLNVQITGTTTITGFGTAASGTFRRVRFAGALTLTHNATSLILPGATNITTAAGDVAEFVSEGSGNWRCVGYLRASGASVVAPFQPSAAVIGDSKAQGSSAQTYVTAGTWVTRDLNTEFSDPYGIVSISSNQFTLSSGSDYLVEYSASYRLDTAVVSHRIYDVTGGSVVTGSYAATHYSASGGVQEWGQATGRALLAGGKTYRVEVYSGNNSIVLGAAMNISGVPETYLTMSIARLR